MRALTGRVGLLGDIHAEDVSLEAALATFARQGCEAVLSVGDVVDGPGDLSRCLSLLARAGVSVVRGNHERWLLTGRLRDLDHAHRLDDLYPADVAQLSSWPATLDFTTPLGLLQLCHGVGDNDMMKVPLPDEGDAYDVEVVLGLLGDRPPALIVNGHSHKRMVRRLGPVIVVNAGTLFREHDPCCAVLDLASGEVTYFELYEGVVLGQTTVRISR